MDRNIRNRRNNKRLSRPRKAGKPQKTPEKLPVIKTASELAKLVFRNKSQITRWQQDARWSFGRPPWPRSLLPQILAWSQSELDPKKDEPGAEETKTLRREKLRREISRLVALEEKAQLDLEQARGQLVSLADAKRIGVAIVTTAKNRFRGLISIAPQLVGLDTAAVQGKLETEIEAILNDIANSFSAAFVGLAQGAAAQFVVGGVPAAKETKAQ